MSLTQNLSNDTTLAYLLNKNQKQVKGYADKEVAKLGETVDSLSDTVDGVADRVTGNETAIAKMCRDVIEVTLPNVSSSKRTFSVEGITSRHELIQNGFAYLSNRSAACGKLTLTTGEGEITVTGALRGTTNIQATFCIKEQKESGS